MLTLRQVSDSTGQFNFSPREENLSHCSMTKKYLASSEGKVKYECSSMVDYLSDTFEGLGLILSTVEKRTVYIYA